jgi:hypothetical protein
MYSCGFDLSLRTAYRKTSNSLGYWQIIPYYYMTFFLLYSSYFKYKIGNFAFKRSFKYCRRIQGRNYEIQRVFRKKTKC